MKYEELTNINSSDKLSLISFFSGILDTLKHISVHKITSVLRCFPDVCKLHYQSTENRRLRQLDTVKHYHPIRPLRGEIYNAMITEGIGSELCGNHLVIIMQNNRGNTYGEKVNILPIEGDGNRINPVFQFVLTNAELEIGHLDKEPSKVIISDITTIDKARLGRKIGKVHPTHMNEISRLLKNHLNL